MPDLPCMRRLTVRICCYGGLLTILFAPVIAPSVVAEEQPSVYSEQPVTDNDRLHWSFRPIVPIEVPSPVDSAWRQNEIDDFIARQLAQQNLRPQPEATKQTLLRRLSFDLTGLPPTPEEREAFLADTDPQAYSRLVDRLLTSPRHGERWAQHWLDLARFAETDGFEHDKVRDGAWKYRDWVITSLNSDLPYDEFLKQQIAGDELYPGDEAALTATRFCLSGPDMPDINLAEERRHTVLNELTATVAEVVLGLQLGCAQCHDHKYDPISQADFYRFRAIFEPAVRLKKNESLSVFHETAEWSQTSHLMLRGDFRSRGPELSPDVLRVLAFGNHDYSPRATNTSSGRRIALAEWLVAPENPLTARVFVNRVWQHHFGTGLVNTPSEFGIMGSNPTHPELLDWLSGWFVDHGWSLRSLHRLIVMSATYRQRSSLSAESSAEERSAWSAALQDDPNAALLSRFPRRRLEGEAIRDAMLTAAGQINLKAGGPSVRPPLPKELLGTLLKKQWEVTDDESEHVRRSVYVFARRNLRYPIFEVFDRPSANASCASRGVSTTAPQSLHLLNSEFSLNMSQALADVIRADHADWQPQVDAAFVRTLNRPPSPQELAEVERFFAQSAATEADPLVHLCLSLFNCNEFVVVD
ncbi:MAG: DUF1549 and DUF1553 domain-containing protein [Planctomycetaceae bacterium]